jgi:hypothetical protein
MRVDKQGKIDTLYYCVDGGKYTAWTYDLVSLRPHKLIRTTRVVSRNFGNIEAYAEDHKIPLELVN